MKKFFHNRECRDLGISYTALSIAGELYGKARHNISQARAALKDDQRWRQRRLKFGEEQIAREKKAKLAAAGGNIAVAVFCEQRMQEIAATGGLACFELQERLPEVRTACGDDAYQLAQNNIMRWNVLRRKLDAAISAATAHRVWGKLDSDDPLYIEEQELAQNLLEEFFWDLAAGRVPNGGVLPRLYEVSFVTDVNFPSLQPAVDKVVAIVEEILAIESRLSEALQELEESIKQLGEENHNPAYKALFKAQSVDSWRREHDASNVECVVSIAFEQLPVLHEARSLEEKLQELRASLIDLCAPVSRLLGPGVSIARQALVANALYAAVVVSDGEGQIQHARKVLAGLPALLPQTQRLGFAAPEQYYQA